MTARVMVATRVEFRPDGGNVGSVPFRQLMDFVLTAIAHGADPDTAVVERRDAGARLSVEVPDAVPTRFAAAAVVPNGSERAYGAPYFAVVRATHCAEARERQLDHRLLQVAHGGRCIDLPEPEHVETVPDASWVLYYPEASKL